MSSFEKKRVEKILVADGNLGLVAGGTALYTDSTGVFNISNEQLGVFDADTDLALYPGDVYADHPRIYIAQGTSLSATPGASPNHPLPNRPIERSQVIDGSRPLVWRGVSYTAPVNNVWVIGAPNAQTDKINVLDETEYGLTIAFDGRRVDMLNGRNQPALFPSITTPDYSTVGPATEVLKRDDLVLRMVQSATSFSKLWPSNKGGGQYLALAVDSQGVFETALGSGATQNLGDFTAGTVIRVGYDDNGNRINHTVTASEAAAMTAAIAANADLGTAADIDIVPFLLSSPPSGSQAATDVAADRARVAGTVSNADMIIIIALDDSTAYYDRIPQTQVRLKVGLSKGFTTTVYNTEEVKPQPRIGGGREWQLLYEETDELRKFGTSQPPGERTFLYDSHIDTTASYDAYIIEHGEHTFTSGGFDSEFPFSTSVLIESADTTTTSAFEAVLNQWMASLPFPRPAVNL